MKAILITGASGLVGSELSKDLLKKGYEVRGLSRNPERLEGGIKGFYWDPESGEMDHSALKGISSLVHLAGENIAEGRWTEKRKREIIESRTRSCDVLASALSQLAAEGEALPESLILASAIGYYGSRGDELLDEESSPGDGFLAETTLAWEQAGQFPQSVRQVRLRIGVVLSRQGGALNEMERPLKLFAGAVPGSGKQYLSWIHHSDLVSIILFSIENSSVKGIYNAVSPDPRTMDSFMRALGREVGRPVYLPNVPGFVLKMMLGEMSEMVLGGARISSARMEKAGFRFQHGNLENALSDLYQR
ncbi:MAG: TIGR01777 family oxidoreductase [Leptospiraceae bacterium]|nr:TIGR01777 family oxidoreductase [Leptospiraceae bacterium]